MRYRERAATHAKRRARERYGMDLTDQDLKDILNLVVKKRATPKMCVTGATVYEVEYKGATIYPLVGRRRGRRQILSMYDWSEDDE